MKKYSVNGRNVSLHYRKLEYVPTTIEELMEEVEQTLEQVDWYEEFADETEAKAYYDNTSLNMGLECYADRAGRRYHIELCCAELEEDTMDDDGDVYDVTIIDRRIGDTTQLFEKITELKHEYGLDKDGDEE